MGDSWVAEKLAAGGDLMKRGRNPSVGTTVSQGIVSVRINARFESLGRAEHELERTSAACASALGELIFGADDDNTLAATVASLLAASRKTVTTAESCTGGLLAKMLTDIPGSSSYFNQGWITYSNDAKYNRLGVAREVLNVYGAVSEPVVEAMAKNARRLAKADFALAISGVAGPTGGGPTKPVGTVCIALASQADPEARGDARFFDSAVVARTFTFPGDREMIRDRSAKMALTMLRFHLLGRPLPF
jgi:nicotinamide-nucleotide amidase